MMQSKSSLSPVKHTVTHNQYSQYVSICFSADDYSTNSWLQQFTHATGAFSIKCHEVMCEKMAKLKEDARYTAFCSPGALEAALGAADPAAATEPASLFESGGSLLDMLSRDSRHDRPAFHESEQNGNQTEGTTIAGATTPAGGAAGLHGE